MHRRKSCIASQYPCITESHALRVNIDASHKIMHHLSKIDASRRIMHCELISKHRRKIFIPSKKLCITRRFHASSKLKHCEKISYLAEIYASREDTIPRQNLYIARRFHTSLKFMHHEKNLCLV